MFTRKRNAENPPGEVVTTLSDLLRFEFLVGSGALLPRKPVYSILAGPHASKLRGRGLDFEEVRPYVAGDDIRNIDWRVTARTGSTYSKVFNEERERPGFIILDMSPYMFFGSKRYVKSVTAAHAAAIGAFYTVKRGDRVGGIVFNEADFDYVPPKRGKMPVQHLLERIAKRSAELVDRDRVTGDASTLNGMLNKARSFVNHDFVISVISDFSHINDETRHHLRELRNHNDVILVHIHDAMDERLPDGNILLADGSRQIMWQNNRRDRGAKYRQSFTEWQSSFTDEYRRYGIPVVFLNTEEPVEQQLVRTMRKLTTRSV